MPFADEVVINVVHSGKSARCGRGAVFIPGLLAMVQARDEPPKGGPL